MGGLVVGNVVAFYIIPIILYIIMLNNIQQAHHEITKTTKKSKEKTKDV